MAAPPAPVFGADGSRLPGIDGTSLKRYDFQNPGLLSAADLRQLAQLHQRYVQNLAARLSTFLRIDCELKLEKVDSAPFAQVMESMAGPTQITMFQIEPLRGVGVVELTPTLGLVMADRLLGGKGRVEDTQRSLSEIEMTLLEDAVHIVIADWARLWQGDNHELVPRILGHETSGRFIQTAAADSTFVTVTATMTLGDLNERLQLAVPFLMIEGVLKKMQRPRGLEETKARPLQWRAPFGGINVPVTAEWEVKEIALRDVARMQVGDVIQLPRELIDQTRIRLSGTAEFVGTVGVKDGYVAIQITDRLPKS
jgi:flagellar motor switch protein FliM